MEGRVDERVRRLLLRFQRAEITGHHVYLRIARRQKEGTDNRAILERIASDELEHYLVWKGYTGQDVRPNWAQIIWYVFLSYVLGFTFVIKRLERDEEIGGRGLRLVEKEAPEAHEIMLAEEEHEELLLGMLNEERLSYVGAMVLGLNDALVELTGAIVGITFAFADNRLIALSGIITGVSATLSMAASNYLAERADNNPNALKSSFYTGAAYLVTVALLVLPYLLFPADRYVPALLTMFGIVVLIIICFNYYVSVARSTPFWRRFLEMACISLGVAAVSFLIGLLAKNLLGIEI